VGGRRPGGDRRQSGGRRLLEIGMLALAVGEGGDCWVNRPLVVRNCRRRLDLGHGRRRLDGRREAVRLEGSGGRDGATRRRGYLEDWGAATFRSRFESLLRGDNRTRTRIRVGGRRGPFGKLIS